MDVLTKHTVVIISQHIFVSNHHGVQLKFTQCYMPIVHKQSWKNKDGRNSMAQVLEG